MSKDVVIFKNRFYLTIKNICSFDFTQIHLLSIETTPANIDPVPFPHRAPHPSQSFAYTCDRWLYVPTTNWSLSVSQVHPLWTPPVYYTMRALCPSSMANWQWNLLYAVVDDISIVGDLSLAQTLPRFYVWLVWNGCLPEIGVAIVIFWKEKKLRLFINFCVVIFFCVPILDRDDRPALWFDCWWFRGLCRMNVRGRRIRKISTSSRELANTVLIFLHKLCSSKKNM